MIAARWWHAEGDDVVCDLCCHRCRLADGEPGACGTRWAESGQLRTLGDGSRLIVRTDWIESKFLYHVAPGARTLSFAVPGCSFRCRYCQNWMVSQPGADGAVTDGEAASPAELVQRAIDAGCRAVAATYTEPTVFAELVVEVARAARARGLMVVAKTNGFIEAAPQDELIALLDAVNVDLKAWSPSTHQRLVGAPVEPVLEALRRYHRAGVWCEVTTLVVTGLNDSNQELAAIAGFVAGELGPEVPWHVTRFHPDHELRDRPPTPPATLRSAVEIGRAAGLCHVYTDAAVDGDGWDTRCAGCGESVLRRSAYRLAESRLIEGHCPRCGRRAAGRALAAGGVGQAG